MVDLYMYMKQGNVRHDPFSGSAEEVLYAMALNIKWKSIVSNDERWYQEQKPYSAKAQNTFSGQFCHI